MSAIFLFIKEAHPYMGTFAIAIGLLLLLLLLVNIRKVRKTFGDNVSLLHPYWISFRTSRFCPGLPAFEVDDLDVTRGCWPIHEVLPKLGKNAKRVHKKKACVFIGKGRWRAHKHRGCSKWEYKGRGPRGYHWFIISNALPLAGPSLEAMQTEAHWDSSGIPVKEICGKMTNEEVVLRVEEGIWMQEKASSQIHKFRTDEGVMAGECVKETPEEDLASARPTVLLRIRRREIN